MHYLPDMYWVTATKGWPGAGWVREGVKLPTLLGFFFHFPFVPFPISFSLFFYLLLFTTRPSKIFHQFFSPENHSEDIVILSPWNSPVAFFIIFIIITIIFKFVRIEN